MLTYALTNTLKHICICT